MSRLGENWPRWLLVTLLVLAVVALITLGWMLCAMLFGVHERSGRKGPDSTGRGAGHGFRRDSVHLPDAPGGAAARARHLPRVRSATAGEAAAHAEHVHGGVAAEGGVVNVQAAVDQVGELHLRLEGSLLGR